MKKLLFLLSLCYFCHFSFISAQNTYHLENGKTIYETNGNLFDITRGDSLKILKNVILIKYSAGTPVDSIASIENVYKIERRYICSTGWIIYNVPDTTEIVSLVTDLLYKIDSSDLQFNYQLTYFSSISNDPEFINQWYLPDIMVPEAWDMTTGNQEVKVAVLDNGTDWNNDDIGPNNFLGWDFINNNNNTLPTNSTYWHGNMVSSIIAAKTNNNLGSSGIAGGWNSSPVKIVMCKIGDAGPDLAAATAAIDWAIKQGIRLFNFSWGVQVAIGECSCYSYTYLKDEIDYAYDNYGAIMFSAADNQDLQNAVAWPGCGDKVISVGGTNRDGNRWSKSHPKEGSNYGINLDISAPCVDIIYPEVGSLTYSDTFKTSCAVPIAVGVAALMLSINPCLSNVDIQYILQKTADKTGSYNYNWDPTRPGHSQELGYGKINAFQAVAMASNWIDEIAEYNTVTFDTPRWFTHNLTLLYGSTLTITSTVTFNEGCKIIVEPGAKLIIDGGTLTSTCPGFWAGIEVRGNPLLPQAPTSNQGYVKVFNHGLIERANPGIYSVNGGIVTAIDATFRNNKRSVIISNYAGWNHTSFTHCTFELTDETGLFGNQYFIGTEFVDPIKVSGCTFENKIAINKMEYAYRGYGILSLDANVYVMGAQTNPPGAQTDPTVFKNLAYGIYSMHSGSQYSFHIDETIFDGNLKGAYLSGYHGSSYALIIKSQFKVLNPSYASGKIPYGLYLDNCSGYTVEENEFYALSEHASGYGLIINESGQYDNEIYNNRFHNLQFASQAQGCNRYSYPYNGGLCYKCNDFFGNDNDINIISDNAQGAPNQGISLSQGDKTFPAKNTFSGSNSSNGYDINNPFDQIVYFLDQYANGNNISPFPTIGVLNFTVASSTYNKNIDCSSHFGGNSDIQESIDELTEAEIKADSVLNILNGLIDGGSTETMVNSVEMSTPPESLQTRDNLLTQSPYLSDSVMKVAIAKEDVLPNAMIRDILVENPHSTKSDALIDALEQRAIPMPDSLMAQIMVGQNILGAKAEKEQELIKWNQHYSIALKNLIRIYDADTIGLYGVDSLISLMNQDSSLISRYDLVSLYYSKGMFETGDAILNNISSNYVLSENQQSEHAMYLSLFPVIYQLVTDTNGIWSIDSTQIALLTNLATNENSLPGVYARNLLIKRGIWQYDEPILLVSTFKDSKKWHVNDDPFLGNSQESCIKAYPNPANNYFIVEYRITKEAPGIENSVILTNMLGHDIANIKLKRNVDQIVIPTDNLSTGVYIVSLKSNGVQKDQLKLIINK